ncbi:hypothetical protein ACFFV7_03155 [Nonomuraea spiralis]|uniref:Uncharacterized protein n=1 Tax=Nonomuraea spiralis TaxID=46182 RepID=A0ABV5I8B0_9ACTN|nr:hypothetical protein [Nonomuraea spiralis]
MQHDQGLTITCRPHSERVRVLAVGGDLDHHTSPACTRPWTNSPSRTPSRSWG